MNSVALHVAGIDAATRNPANGTIERDASGQATGVVKEGASFAINPLIPKFSQEQFEQGILKEIDDLHREGVTFLQGHRDPPTQRVYQNGRLAAQRYPWMEAPLAGPPGVTMPGSRMEYSKPPTLAIR